MLIEGIAVTVDDVRRLASARISRIELVSGMAEGGLTPSYAMIETALNLAQAIPVNVMIRPHANSFSYLQAEIEMMCRDIEIAKQLGAHGVVFGCLTSEGQIDHIALKQLLTAAEGIDVTFHRAFDEVINPVEALLQLSEYSTIRRILTSGGQAKATDATQQLNNLVSIIPAHSTLKIMGGSGLYTHNVVDFVNKTNVHEVHFGSGIRHQHSFSKPIDEALIKQLQALLA